MAHTRLAGRSTKKSQGCRTIVSNVGKAAREGRYEESISIDSTIVESSVGKDETAEESGGRAESDRGRLLLRRFSCS